LILSAGILANSNGTGGGRFLQRPPPNEELTTARSGIPGIMEFDSMYQVDNIQTRWTYFPNVAKNVNSKQDNLRKSIFFNLRTKSLFALLTTCKFLPQMAFFHPQVALLLRW
jgi:hypothetical protein